MSLEESLRLVTYAFANGISGDIFAQKAPSVTIEVLALAIKDIFNSSSKFKIIGTRHGEKLYESLLSSEEMARAKDLGDYYCINADTRDLNYSNYFDKGDQIRSNILDYNSHNANKLNIEETKNILLKLDYIKKKLDA